MNSYTTIRFKPNKKISKIIDGKLLVIFLPSTEYEGKLYSNGTLTSDCGKYPGTYKVLKNNVKITKIVN